MARPGQPRVRPDAASSPQSPDPALREPARLRPALGGGRRRGPGESLPAAPTARELWLAVHLPRYVLESLLVRFDARQYVTAPDSRAAVAIVDLEQGAKVIRGCDARASAAGIEPGMALNSALALQPDLRVLSRDPASERALLEAVATAALDFTPRVNLEPPDGVLLEVRGSLRLFGGPRRLCELLRQRLQCVGLEPAIALTPAPLASLWFARAGEEVVLRRPGALAARLASLPLAVTRWPERMRQSLATMGVRNVGGCVRLPRDGLARRFEPRLRLELDRALGRAPDPRPGFAAAVRFKGHRDLEPELTDTDRLQHACRPLLDELCTFLRGRGAGIASLELCLVHRESAATRLRLRFAGPVASVARIERVLGERLCRTALCAPVRTVRLRSGPLLEAPAEAAELFVLDRRRAAALPQLIEQLRARLGAEAVHGLCLVPEHRPEAAQRRGGSLPGRPPAAPSVGAKRGDVAGFARDELSLPRPVWLLEQPQLLEGGDRPCHQGPLEIEAGPERIESGWWDGHDVRRDYYVARSPAGVRLWIFRERRPPGGWFLHGVFG